MAPVPQAAALAALKKSRDFTKLLAMMALSFLVIFVVGVLRPIRDAIALDGLEPGDFYQVYFVSAIVVLFVPLYNRLADRLRWKDLIPGVALFFAASMVLFRFLYLPGSAAFGMAFYGWYDLMVAALVTQFFMATQIFYNARDAKKAYPLVIAAGSMGAAIGGGITAFFAQRVGTANLLLVAGAAIVLFAFGLILVWRREDPDAGRTRDQDNEGLSTREFRQIFSNRQVQLIALTVLLTVLVKQFVDYQYKTLTREVFVDLDRVSGFLGLVDAATQWLPIVVLLALRPILRRWGAGVAILIFPVSMIFATGALATVLSLPVAVVARTSERMFRYSAERTGREILYVPVPDGIKLRAKAYIDVAIEKGLGKVLSGLVILALVLATGGMSVMNRLVLIGFLGVGVAFALLIAFLRIRKEYVRSLASSIEGRFASFRGTYVPILGPEAREMVRGALTDEARGKVAFGLDLIEQGGEESIDAFADELDALLTHDSVEIRRRALEILSLAPDAASPASLRERLKDAAAEVRVEAVRTLSARSDTEAEDLFGSLLRADDPRVRSAALTCLADAAEPEVAARVARPFFADHLGKLDRDDRTGRLELAIAAGLLDPDDEVTEVVRRLMDDRDVDVAIAAIGSAGRLGTPALIQRVISALGSTRTRAAARASLAARGDDVLPVLTETLSARATDPAVRRSIPAVLGDIPSEASVDALVTSYMLPETEQILDNRALRALGRIRAAGGPGFPEDRVFAAIEREVAAARRYLEAEIAATDLSDSPVVRLLQRSLDEAVTDRRESAFRWLGLVFAQDGMYRSFLAIESEEDRPRANALEWLESTIGHVRFAALRPVLFPDDVYDEVEAGIGALRPLWDDEDVWLARLALRACHEADPNGTRDELRGYSPGDPDLRAAANAMGRTADLDSSTGDHEMDLIEKVFLLQNVDLLSGARSQQLALLASIARELDADPDRVLLSRDEPTDALYVVIDGEVTLEGIGAQSVTISAGQAFGTWALIDREPSLVEARTRTKCRLLKIGRSDFRDLLVDNPELGLDLLEGLAARLRALAAVAAA